MEKLIEIILANSGWILALIAFCIPPIRDFIIKKFQSSLDKALEDKKSINDRKNYISKARFDAEFQIYRELSKDFFDLVKQISNLFPYNDQISSIFTVAEEDSRYEYMIYDKSQNAYVTAQDRLHANSAFISEDFYKDYNKILELCLIQLTIYKSKWIITDCHEADGAHDCSERTKEICDRLEDLNRKVRKYLSNLDVL